MCQRHGKILRLVTVVPLGDVRKTDKLIRTAVFSIFSMMVLVSLGGSVG